ncbi:transcription termination/antitermination NusG family protein [Oceaniglobus trochenteri]|uniref:transcription termination/antitermination NusG family protein n=1 Tax=Oceaniglobus trochenteri TaxID=2763260 RepID=UPI001CFF78F4|nr:transcription termination/antitermination NusG family protein [Oceaniglobus trochenteri]
MSSFAIGDMVTPAPAAAALSLGGAREWYALLCQPQREEAAERWLALRGVYAFHPVLRRKQRVRGHLREYTRRYLPGYVFARFDGAPRPHAVLACPFITGALCGSFGHWGRLDAGRLASLHAMRAVDEAKEAQRRSEKARRVAAARLRPGDRALFRSGPMAGQHCEVVALTAADGVQVRLTLLGGVVAAQADTADLVKLRDKDA